MLNFIDMCKVTENSSLSHYADSGICCDCTYSACRIVRSQHTFNVYGHIVRTLATSVRTDCTDTVYGHGARTAVSSVRTGRTDKGFMGGTSVPPEVGALVMSIRFFSKIAQLINARARA